MELAVCLPALVLLVFAAIEASNVIFIKQCITAAAYEGARTAIRRDATSADARTRTQEVIDARRVSNAQITIAPSEVRNIARGTAVAITVTADCNSNAVGPSWYFTGQTLTATITMVKE